MAFLNYHLENKDHTLGPNSATIQDKFKMKFYYQMMNQMASKMKNYFMNDKNLRIDNEELDNKI